MDLLEKLEIEATKQSKEKLEKLENEDKNNSKYEIPSELKNKKYYEDGTGIYCPLNVEGYYLKMWREFPKGNTNKTYFYSYYDKKKGILNPSKIKLEHGFYDYSPDDDDKNGFSKTLNKLLGYKSKFIEFQRSNRENNEKFVIENLSTIFDDFNELLQNGKVITILTDEYKPRENTECFDEDKKNKNKSFKDFPPQTQKDATKLLEEGGVFNNIKKASQSKHINDEKLTETLILICGSIYSGSPVQTIVGGETGKGKTDITQAITKNFPKNHLFFLRTFSPKYIYYDRSNFNEDYNILIIDDVDLSKRGNIEIIKELTDNKKKIKELRTVIDGRAEIFTLTGKFIIILTYAKNNPDIELSNRLFNTGIITDQEHETEVKHKIKSNTLIDIDNNSFIKELQKVNKCAITKLVEKKLEILNPYLFFINPEQLNNRDVNAFINLVNAYTFYNIYQREVLQFDDKNIIIGKKEDIEKVLNLWDSKTQKYKLNTRQCQILNLPLPEYTLEEVEEHRQKVIDMYENELNNKEKIKKSQWSRERIARELGVNPNTVKFDLDTNRRDSTNNTLYSLGLIDRYRFNDDHNSMYVYYKLKNDNEGVKSLDVVDYSVAIEKYISKIGLNEKRVLIINLLYKYNYIINKEVYIYIKKYCQESIDINDDKSMFNFLQNFFNTGVELMKKNENTSIFEIVEMYEIIEPYINNKYIYTQATENPNSENIKKQPNKTLNQNQTLKREVHSKCTYCNNDEITNKDQNTNFDLEKLNTNISDTDINELIQNNLEHYSDGLTYKEIIEKIFEYYNLYPDSQENEHTILRIEKTLSDLIKSKIIFKTSHKFKQVYKLEIAKDEEY